MSLRNIVNVAVQVAGGGGRADFGRTLFLHCAGLPDTTEQALRDAQIRAYAGIEDLADDWPSGEPRKAANIYFQQQPYPKDFLVGACHPTGSRGYVFGGQPGSIEDIEALSGFTHTPTGAVRHDGVSYFVDETLGALWSVDGSTGAARYLAAMGLTRPRALFSDGTTLYVIDASNSSLYSIDTSDYSLTLVGEITGVTGSIDGAAVHSGTVYLINAANKTLYRLALTTRAATAVGSGLGAAATNPVALVSNGNKLYALDEADQKLLTLNLTSGAATAATGTLTEASQAAFYDGTNIVVLTVGPASAAYTVRVSDGTDTEVAALYGPFRLELLGTESLVINTKGLTTLEAVAAAIQSAFVTRITGGGLSVSASNGKLIVSVPPQDLGAGFTDSDESRVLGLSSQVGARTFDGSSSETITQALDRLAQIDPDFYFVTLAEGIVDTDDVAEAAEWAASNDRFLLADSHEERALELADTTSVIARLAAPGSPSASAIWSRTSDYKAVSLAARFSAVNFGGVQSLITAKFRRLYGTVPDELTPTQAAALRERGVNWYSTVGGTPIIQEGTSFGGWIDMQVFLDWLVTRIRGNLFNALLSANRVPQTDDGIAALKEAAEDICAQGVRNGGIAPGTLAETQANAIRLATGNPDFTGFLSNGYLVHVLPVAEQPQADREARKAPPVSVWLKGSGAVHFVNIGLVFES